MNSSFIYKEKDSYEPVSVVKCYYMNDTKKTVLMKLPDGKVISIPKNAIQSEYIRNKSSIQDLIVDDWILRKVGLVL